MDSVATGETLIDDAHSEYVARRREISDALRQVDGVAGELEHPNPHDDLWEYHAHWSANLPTYALRRAYVRSL